MLLKINEYMRFLWFTVRHPILVCDAIFDPGTHDTSF